MSQEEIRAQAALRQPVNPGVNSVVGMMQHMMPGGGGGVGQTPMGGFGPIGAAGLGNGGLLPQDNPCKVFCGGLPATVDRGEDWPASGRARDDSSSLQKGSGSTS